jgi:hypothetical protein
MHIHIWKYLCDWLQHATRSDVAALPPENICRAIASDSTSRGALVALMTEVFNVPPPDPHIDVQQCQEDLPAFIDLETSNGTYIAIHEYPHVWWRLWVDTDLSDVYRLTTHLLDAEQAGFLAPLNLSALSDQHLQYRVVAQIGLSGAFLNQAFAVQSLLGTTRGADDDAPVLVELDDAEHRISLGIQKQPDDAHTLTVVVVPPVNGRAVVARGDVMLRASFDVHGVAVLHNIAAYLLSEHRDIDLIIRIEAETEDDTGVAPSHPAPDS